MVSHYAFTCYSINNRDLSRLFRSQNTADHGEVSNKANTSPPAAVAGRHSPAKVQPSIWPVEVTPGQVPSTSHLQVEHPLDYRQKRTESSDLNFNHIFLASVTEEWRRTAMASMNPPSTPSWTTYAKTATTSTRSQMFTRFVGEASTIFALTFHQKMKLFFIIIPIPGLSASVAAISRSVCKPFCWRMRGS